MLSPGDYSVTARMVGMSEVTKEGVTVLADQSTEVDFSLSQEAAGTTVITVTDQLNLILEDVPSTIYEIDRTGETVNSFGYIDVDTESMPPWEKYAASQCVIDVDGEGYIYYTSVVDYRVFKYDPEGNLVFTVEGSTPFEARYERQPPNGLRTLFPVVRDLCVDQNCIYVL